MGKTAEIINKYIWTKERKKERKNDTERKRTKKEPTKEAIVKHIWKG